VAERAFVQDLDLGALDEAEFQEPALQLLKADPVAARMALGADIDDLRRWGDRIGPCCE
jgi:hypothetical protein